MTCTHRSLNRTPCRDVWKRTGATLDCVVRLALVLLSIWSNFWDLWSRAQAWGFRGFRGREREKQWFPKRERNSVQQCGDLWGERGRRRGREGEIALLYQLCPQIQIPNVLIPKRIRELKPNPFVFSQICLKRTEILFFENVKESGWAARKADYAEARAVVSRDTTTDWKSQLLTLHPKSMTEKWNLKNIIWQQSSKFYLRESQNT